MKKIPILNMTPRQLLIDHTAATLRRWSARYDRVPSLRDGCLIAGVGVDDLKVAWGEISHISGRAINAAVAHVIDGAQEGTIGGTMLAYSDSMGPSAWASFKTAVRKAATR
jgi:hypothetical protein